MPTDGELCGVNFLLFIPVSTVWQVVHTTPWAAVRISYIRLYSEGRQPKDCTCSYQLLIISVVVALRSLPVCVCIFSDARTLFFFAYFFPASLLPSPSMVFLFSQRVYISVSFLVRTSVM